MENPIQCVTLYQNDLKTNVSHSLFYWVKREIILLLFCSFFEKTANHVMTIILAGLFFLYSAALQLLKRWDSWEEGGKEGWCGRGGQAGRWWKQRTARWIPATKWRDGSLKCWINLRLSLSLSQRGLQSEGRPTPWIPPLPPHALARSDLALLGPLWPPFHSTGKQTCRTGIVNAWLQNFTSRCLVSSSTGLPLCRPTDLSV